MTHAGTWPAMRHSEYLPRPSRARFAPMTVVAVMEEKSSLSFWLTCRQMLPPNGLYLSMPQALISRSASANRTSRSPAVSGRSLCFVCLIGFARKLCLRSPTRRSTMQKLRAGIEWLCGTSIESHRHRTDHRFVLSHEHDRQAMQSNKVVQNLFRDPVSPTCETPIHRRSPETNYGQSIWWRKPASTKNQDQML